MSKIINLFIGILCLCLTVTRLKAQDKMVNSSAFTKMYLSSAARIQSGKVNGYVYKTYQGVNYISAFIQTKNNIDKERLQQQYGVKVGTQAGSIWTVQIPLNQVNAVAHDEGISYLQLDEPFAQNNDSARKVTQVDSVHNGAGLSLPYLGKGVIVGVVDIGFDFTNPVLWDTGGTQYRVKRVWTQKQSGTPPSGFIYGNEMTDSNALFLAATDNAKESHGSHVVGTAAGSGYGSLNNKQYRGMAPLSDIVLVGIQPEQNQWVNTGGTDILDGINYVYQYAQSVSKPAVVNLSWGASNGPHDGTSLFSQALDHITGAGKIFVNSAGNSGAVKLHIKKTFTANDSVVNTFEVFDSRIKKSWVDIWGDTAKKFCVAVTLYHADTAFATTGFVCMDSLLHTFQLIGSNNDTCFVNIVNNPSEFNQKPHGFIGLNSQVPDSIAITVKSFDGIIHIWNNYVEAPVGYSPSFSNFGKAWAVAGDTAQTISDNCSGKNVIAVGAFVSKKGWKNIAGTVYSYSGSNVIQKNIAPFSSMGPSQDGRIKPDITAPGMGLASTINSFDSSFMPGGSSYTSSVVYSYLNPKNNRNYRYAVLAGTSMSSPTVAGIVALLLEVNPLLTPVQIKDILNQTAIHDSYTGSVANNIWGGGKINAYQAIKRTLQLVSVPAINQHTLACHSFPNPTKGYFNLDFLAEKEAVIHLTINDINGKFIYQNKWTVQQGYNLTAIDISNSPKGVYFLNLSGIEGQKTIKIIVD